MTVNLLKQNTIHFLKKKNCFKTNTLNKSRHIILKSLNQTINQKGITNKDTKSVCINKKSLGLGNKYTVFSSGDKFFNYLQFLLYQDLKKPNNIQDLKVNKLRLLSSLSPNNLLFLPSNSCRAALPPKSPMATSPLDLSCYLQHLSKAPKGALEGNFFELCSKKLLKGAEDLTLGPQGLPSGESENKNNNLSVQFMITESSSNKNKQECSKTKQILNNNEMNNNNFAFLATKTKSYSNQNWGSFFPYRKTFVCYWLLPLLGFVSYLSVGIPRPKNLSEQSIRNQSNLFTVNILTQNSHLDKIKLSNLNGDKNKNMESLEKNNSILFLQENSKKPNLQSLNPEVKNSKTQFWYQTTLVSSFKKEKVGGNISSHRAGLEDLVMSYFSTSFSFSNSPQGSPPPGRASKENGIDKDSYQYPNKFYDVPLNLLTKKPIFQFLQEENILNASNNVNTNNALVKTLNNSEFNLKKQTKLTKLTTKKLVKNHYTVFSYDFSDSVSTVHQLNTLNKYFLGIKNLLLLPSYLQHPPRGLQAFPQTFFLKGLGSLTYEEREKRNNTDNKKQLTNFKATKNTILSYKNASFLLDDFYKENLINTNFLKTLLAPMPSYLQHPLLAENKITSQLSKSLLFPKSFNSILFSFFSFAKKEIVFEKNNKIIASSFQEYPFPQGSYCFRSKAPKTIVPFLSYAQKREGGKASSSLILKTSPSFIKPLKGLYKRPALFKNKFMYLEEMISFLEKSKKITDSEANISEDLLKISQKNSKYSLNKSELTHLKLTKDQLYTILIKTMFNQINSVKDLVINNKSLNNKVIKLNHPLLFSTVNSFTGDNLNSTIKENSIHLTHTVLTNNNFLLTQNVNSTIPQGSAPRGLSDLPSYPQHPSPEGGSSYDTVLSQTKNSFNIKPNLLDSQNKYINFVSIKFKEIVKPFYPFIFKKEKINTYLLKKAQQEDMSNKIISLNQSFNEPLTKKVNKSKIYSIFRSYLSKKQFIYSYKTKKFVTKKIKVFVPSTSLLEIQNKTSSFLQNFKNTSPQGRGDRKKQKDNTKNKQFLYLRTRPLGSAQNGYSTNSLFKNRVFILKSNNYKFNSLSSLGGRASQESNLDKKVDYVGSGYFEKLEKRKYNQKKHRRKKQRKETRHRKKRKRFYPRATWSRYKMYTNLLKTVFVEPKLTPQSSPIKQTYFTNFVKIVDLYDNKDFYQIKQNVLVELKRSFWKSYWLRSNLKPYLNNIKLYLKDIEKTSSKETLVIQLTNLINYLSGLNTSSFDNSKTIPNLSNNLVRVKDKDYALLPVVKTNMPQRGEIIPSSTSLTNIILYQNQLSNLSHVNLSFDSLDSTTSNSLSQNKWQLMTQIHEHNRIMFERIQNIILNIRENLTLNGQFKARPIFQKLQSLSSLKQNHQSQADPQGNPDFWSKLSKAISSFFTQSSIKYNGDFVNNRIYWAINKTNLGSFKTIHQVKSLWMNTKTRDQSKANKTKKLMYNFNKYLGVTFSNQQVNNKGSSNTKFYAVLPSLEGRPFLFPRRGEGFVGQKLGELLMKGTSNSSLPQGSLASQANFRLFILSSLPTTNTTFPQGKSSSTDNLKPENQIVFQGEAGEEKDGTILSYDNAEKIQLALQLTERKFRQKEQKFLNLGFLPTLQTSTNNSEPYWLGLSKNDGSKNSNMESKSSTILPGQFKNFTNEINYWWDASKLQFIPTFSNEFCSIFDFSPEGKNNKINQNQLNLQSSIFVHQTNFSYQVSSISAITFLFHFCSVISLISISQIRDFISFTLIVLSKVSKIYLNLMYSSFNLFLQFTKNIYGLWPKTSDSLILNPVNFKNNNRAERLNLQGKQAYNYKGHILKNKTNIYKKLLSLPSHAFFFYKRGQVKDSAFYYLSKNLFQNTTKGMTLEKNKTKILYTWYSILFYSSINALTFAVSNISFLTYSYFLKSLNFVETFVRSIYTFFEKPGELIIDWIAYFFLVEWSSDLTNTIPDTIDTNFSNFLTKSLKVQRFPTFAFTDLMTQMVSTYGLVNMPNMYSSVLSTGLPLTSGLMQRRILSIYLLEALNIACRPDTDLIVRQQKGYVFWDIWSDLFITVAEDASINISELSNLKEEQNKLLEKLMESQTNLDKAQSKLTFFSKIVQLSNKKKSTKQLLGIKTGLKLPYGLVSTPFIGLTLNNKNTRSGRPALLENKINYSSEYNTNFISLDSKIKRVTNNLSKNVIKTLSWSSSQFLSYQGKDTELFIDLHPPKSFSHPLGGLIKYSESINQPIGLVLCQVFSGIFYKQVAKNLLVVGPQGDQKSLLIQAIAGETELKIITDNAHRYAMVFRGVAVGIKLLRDVFEALTLHTPCIFLLEDIHAIGERRPFLISDDENTKGLESSVYQDKDYALQGNEKNQVIYQLTKHMVSHYKKPYKGDFSLSIPTNHFCFDLFNTQNASDSLPKRRQKSTLTSLSPLSLNNKDTVSNLGFTKINSSDQVGILASVVQLPKNQLLAPPATSPFSVLVLKEEKKFKPKKIVKEYPWSGLPYEQYSNIAKASYSIRVKVALLADMVLSNLSVKLDMITDLLVIIDSVKGNRGFVVFATTHVPYILDPALRRPGRFDETLSLPKVPNLLSRWQICKYNINLWHYKNGHNSNLNNTNLFVTKATSTINYGNALASTYPIGISLNLWQSNILFSYAAKNNLSNQKLKSKLNKGIMLPFNLSNNSLSPFASRNLNLKANGSQKSKKNYALGVRKLNKKSTMLTIRVYNLVSKIFLLLHESNSQNKWGDFVFSLIHSNNSINPSNTQGSLPPDPLGSGKASAIFTSTLNNFLSKDSLIYTSLYSSPNIFKQHLTILMAGQLGFLFAKGTIINNGTDFSLNKKGNFDKNGFNKLTIFDNTWRTASSLIYSFIQKRWIYSSNSNQGGSGSSKKNTILPLQQSLLFGSPVLNSLFDFGLEGYKKDIPSPPSSNILLPAKRYENYKRTAIYSQLKRKTNTSISDTIQIHQQQRLIKRLYKIPLKDNFRSEILTNFNLDNELNNMQLNKQQNNYSSFSNASIILAPLESLQQKPTSINWYFRQRILNRHRSYLSNQWWNGQLQEHNTESTFLSDIDWRFTISSSLTEGNLSPDQKQGVIGDLFIDFPDSEQYYNPKNQRWVNTLGSWNSWFDFHKASIDDYSSHYMFECITTAYKCLDKNRELLDSYVICILEKGNLSLDDEIELLEVFKRLG